LTMAVNVNVDSVVLDLRSNLPRCDPQARYAN
jgi:hypothetical protein